MRRKTKSLLLCLMGLFFFKANAQSIDNNTQVIIVRHAEKEAVNNADPDLSSKGKMRAERIASLLTDVKIDQLYTTRYKRTEQTLAPLAASKHLTAEHYNPAEMQQLAAHIINTKGKTIVIAGHSNTVPQLVNMLLKKEQYTNLPEDEFGKMWVLTLNEGKVISCIVLNTN